VPRYAYGEFEPEIHPDAYVHPDAVLIGQVHLGPWSSVWPGCVLRADNGPIHVGERTSIQDGSVLHTTRTDHTTVGANCVVGHMVHLEGCVIEDGCLIGNGSIVLFRARVGAGALVGAQAVVTNGMQVPPGAMAVGVPARIKEGGADPVFIAANVQAYVDKVTKYKQLLRRLD
jgi:carbonic anhydrase/acetyltransferase-like protein (isoleucine patch superfamily)